MSKKIHSSDSERYQSYIEFLHEKYEEKLQRALSRSIANQLYRTNNGVQALVKEFGKEKALEILNEMVESKYIFKKDK
ncbi:hypothetical protein V7166_20480 [Bacillus thuringiensis]